MSLDAITIVNGIQFYIHFFMLLVLLMADSWVNFSAFVENRFTDVINWITLDKLCVTFIIGYWTLVIIYCITSYYQ